MTPEATGMAAQLENLRRDRLTVSLADSICAHCDEAASLPFRAGARVCERCLFDLALAPLGAEPTADATKALAQTIGDCGFGAYVLVEEIGRGGMGVIYRAVHRETNETVAIKTVLPEHASCPETLTRFQREMEAAQSLNHPHAMPIFEVGRSDRGVPFFSMKLACGGNLRHLGPKYRGRWRQIAELMVKIARAVHHAHCQGILHRDLKPGNILFTEDYEPLVTDFGLAKLLSGSDDLTRSFAVLGTPNYVAPEQVTGKTRELTVATDIYGLGTVLFELLTGRPPHVGDDPLHVLQQVSRKSPEPPRRLVPTVPKALDQICRRCLEHFPRNRYASAQELTDDLERWINGHRLAPRPASLVLRKFIQQHRILCLLCASIGVLGGMLWIIWRTALHTADSLQTSVIVSVDDTQQDEASRRVVQQFADELQCALAASQKFVLQKGFNESISPENVLLDPLAYGRSKHSQAVLTCLIRDSGGQSHLFAQLLRCDTGKAVWKYAEILPPKQVNASSRAAATIMVEDLTKNWKESQQKVDQMDRNSLLPDSLTYFSRAMELTKHGNQRDMEASIALFHRALELEPKFVDASAMLAYAHWWMASYYGKVDHYELAIRTANEALAIDPDCSQAHRVIASCYMSEARYDEALEEFGRAVDLNPQSAGCSLSLGICLRRMGHPEKAIPWFKRAVQMEPAYGTFHAWLAETLALCNLDEQAEISAQRAVELEQDQPDSQFALVALRTWQMRFDEARQLCAQARVRFPNYLFGLNFAAWTEFCSGNFADAKSYYEKLRTENSYQNGWVFHGAINPASALAYIAQRAGRTQDADLLKEEALRDDFQLLARYPRNFRVLHDIAATYAIAGDRENALRYLKESLGGGWAEHRSTRIDPRFATLSSLAAVKKLLDGTEPHY